MQPQQRFSDRLGRSATLLLNLTLGLTLAVAQLFTGASMGTAHAATTDCTPNGLVQNCTVTFAYSGAAETWTVPAGVTQATFDLYGAGGGGNTPKGGRVVATLAVTLGATYQVLVGGQNGFNGGGAAGSGSNQNGRGASDVRSGVFGLADRLLVAGGAGGQSSNIGAAGGYPNGGNGGNGSGPGSDDGGGGGGGTQTAGGAAGAGAAGTASGSTGSLGQGGNGGNGTPADSRSGGGGGGGYYGGGGGSSYGPAGATFENGVRAGNGLATITYTQADALAPVANPTQSPAPAPSGWNNTDVTVTWNWTDPAPGSGPVSGLDPANCTTSSVSSGSGILNLSATCRDLAGNVGTATYLVLVDPTAPTANPSQSPAANAAGWNNTDVTVNWNWVSTGAMIDTANCTTSSTSSGEGVLTLSATCRDVANNQRTVPYTVKVDKSAPSVLVTGVSDGATYELGTVPTASCSTSDALPGVATQATLSLTGGNGDGTGSFTATCSGASDLAGNSAAPVSVNYTVNPPADSTAPVITPSVVGTLGANGWYVSDVTVSWNVVDAESAISSQSGCETQSVTSDTSGVTFTCAATSTGGTASQSVTIQRDATAPVVTVTGVSNGANYTLGSVPTAGCSTTDALAGVATQATVNVSGGNGDGTGSFTATCSPATDNAGNSAAPVSVSYTVSAAGVLVGVCGGYEVRQTGNSYSAAGWSGAIKVGTNDKNTLNGGSGPDLILGLGGNDKLDGKGGDDLLCGGDGVDLVQGMAGNDYLDGGNGNDVLNGGSGGYDDLLGGEGNDTLLDGDGVRNASGGAGSDLLTIVLRNGWRNANAQPRFAGLTAGYGNDVVGLGIFGATRFFVDISGDERDNPASPLEGNNDGLGLAGVIDPTSTLIKFEKRLVVSAGATMEIPSEESGAEYLTEPVGEEGSEDAPLANRIFLPLVNR